MVLNRTSDSLSRCDPNLYANIYDVRKRPDIKQQPLSATQPIHKDTIEISRDKLKEEALNRLRHSTKFVIAQNSFMRVGKYLFLAIAFPPYFLIYGLPKWLLVEGIPFAISLFVTMWKALEGKAKEKVEKGSRYVEQLFQFSKKIAQVLIHPVVRLAFEFRQKIMRLIDRGSQFFGALNRKSLERLVSARKKIEKGLTRLQNGLAEANLKIKQKVALIGERMQESVQWIKQIPLSILSWGRLQRLKAINTPLAQRMVSSHQFAQKATQWVSLQVTKAGQSFKKVFVPLANFYGEKMQPVLKSLALNVQNRWKRTRDFFHQKHRNSLSWLDKKQEKLKKLSTHYLIETLLSQAWLPNRVKAWMKKWLFHPIVKACCERALKLYASFATSCLSAISMLLQLASKGVKLLSFACVQLKFFAHLLGAHGSFVIAFSSRMISKGLLYGLYYSILYAMIAAIIVTWGVRSLSLLLNSCNKKLVTTFKQLVNEN